MGIATKLSEQIFNIREKITDKEYLELNNSLHQVYKNEEILKRKLLENPENQENSQFDNEYELIDLEKLENQRELLLIIILTIIILFIISHR